MTQHGKRLSQVQYCIVGRVVKKEILRMTSLWEVISRRLCARNYDLGPFFNHVLSIHYKLLYLEHHDDKIRSQDMCISFQITALTPSIRKVMPAMLIESYTGGRSFIRLFPMKNQYANKHENKNVNVHYHLKRVTTRGGPSLVSPQN